MNELNTLLSENLIFSVPLFIVIGIALLEGTLTLIGFGLSSIVDSIFPELNIETPEIESNGLTFSELFGWINKGRVPTLILLIIFLWLFSIIGLLIQHTNMILNNYYLNIYLVIIISLTLSIPTTRYFSYILSKIIPKDETSAISSNMFTGNECEIILGEATNHNFAEAKFKDSFNQIHYIRVISLLESDSFKKGDIAFIHSQINEKDFYIIKSINENLSRI
jgi:hypothetical protein